LILGLTLEEEFRTEVVDILQQDDDDDDDDI
jgi:hypothetical protein